MRVLVILVGLIYPVLLSAQSLTIKGTVEDTAVAHKLQHVVVSFLKESDSSLVTFVRTDAEGKFQKSVPSGHYILLISSPDYVDYITRIQNPEALTIDLQTIPLISRARLLKEIIVTQQAIRIKGDTTEYLADSFRVRPNATVEDLLKELPGIQVDNSGRITAQGQSVQRILVDGDEFFSDDPTIATRNLRADAVQKVQVFDKKSERAELTGVDDGQRNRTINLELKENAKRGYFGKLSAGGLDKYYNFQAMINAFKAKRKLSAFAITSSTQETGFGAIDAKTYGFSAGSVQTSEETGGLMISSSKEEMGAGDYRGGGLPESIKAGIHYSNKWNEEKVALNGNYLLNNLKVKFNSSSLSQNIIENGVYYNDSKVNSYSDRWRNTAKGTLNLKTDSFSTLRIDVNADMGTDDIENEYQMQNLTDQNRIINNNLRKTISHNDYKTGSLAALYRRKLKKNGQSFSVNVSQSFSGAERETRLNSKSNYFDPVTGNLKLKDTVDQRKTIDLKGSNLTLGTTYTHPLSQTSLLMFDYTFTNSVAEADRQTYNLSIGGMHNVPDYSLSNNFEFIYNVHKGGIQYRYTKGKANVSTGANISSTNLKQTDHYADTSGNRSYLNFYPRLDFTYRFSPYRNLTFGYTGSTGQPGIYQIQPLVDNLDPMNILVGNPNLKPYFTNEFQIFFSDVKISTERYFYTGADMSLINNGINESYRLDEFGRNISQFTNTNGNFSSNIFALVNYKIPNSSWRVGMGPLAQIIRYSNFVELKESITNTSNFRLRTTAQGRVKDRLAIKFAAMPGYYISSSNLSKEADLHFWATNITADSYYQFPMNLEIGTSVIADFRQKVTSFDKNNSIIVWNAYVEKRFLKDGSLALRASIFDILDQNKGYSRYQLARGFYEQRVATWGQYGLISLTYNFVNKGGAPPESGKNSFTF